MAPMFNQGSVTRAHPAAMTSWVRLSCAVAAVLGLGGDVLALDEHDAAKAAVAARASLPLAAIVERVAGPDAEVLDARIERTASTYRYRLKLLEDGHRVRELVVDGRTGAIVAGD